MSKKYVFTGTLRRDDGEWAVSALVHDLTAFVNSPPTAHVAVEDGEGNQFTAPKGDITFDGISPADR